MSSQECSICYDGVTSDTGYTKLSCGHDFHYSCITSWFSVNNGSCPLCRKSTGKLERLPSCLEEEESDDEIIDIEHLAARDRCRYYAAQRYRLMGEEEANKIAATKIQAMIRGFLAREEFCEFKAMVYLLKVTEQKIRSVKLRLRVQRKATIMGRVAWIQYVAIKIQSLWRGHKVYTQFNAQYRERNCIDFMEHTIDSISSKIFD